MSTVGRRTQTLRSAGGIAAAGLWRACLSPVRAAVSILAVVLVLVPAIASAETLNADIVASEEKGYGRIVITFRDRALLPEYDALSANGVLRIRFRDVVMAQVESVPVNMPQYVSIARRDPDGSAIRFALMRDFRVNTMEAGEKLFIDLLPASWQGMPPGLPDDVVRELARRAEEAIRRARALEQARLKGQEEPTVELSVGTNPTFTRLSFDWNVNFDSAFVREGDMVKLTFNQDAPLDLSDLKAHLPPGVIDATAFSDQGKLKFLLRVAPAVDIRAFREGDSYVVDVTPPQMPKDPVNAAIDEALNADAGVASGPTGVIEAPGRAPAVTAPAGQVTGPDIETAPPAAGDATARRAPQPAPAEAAALPVPPAPAPDPAPETVAEAPPPATPISTADVMVAPPAAPVAGESVARGGGALPPAIDLTKIGGASPADANASSTPPAASPERPPVGYDDESRRFVAVEARRIGDMVRVVFPFSERISSAVFRRHQSFFLVFDTSDPIDVRGMRSVLSDMVDAVEVDGDGGNGWQTIRIDLGKDALATVGVDGSSWIMTIGDTILEPSRPLTLDRTVRGDGGTVITIPFREPGKVREVHDPFVGDMVTVVTGFGPARGVLKPQRFVEFDALMSAHGVAVVRKTDDLSVATEGDTIVLERPRGLYVSHGSLDEGTRVLKPTADPNAASHIDLGKIMSSDTKDFLLKIKAMEFNIANTPESARRVPRMNMARFYLAHGFAHEALGLMRLASEEDPLLERDATFNLLMGAAQVLAARPKEALAFLNKPALLNSPDAAIWRTIASAGQRDWNEARLSLPRGRAVVGNYPVFIQTEFNLAAAQTMVEINDYGQAAAVLAEIDPSLATHAQAARYDIIRGQIADASGRSREALTAFDLVKRSDVRPLAAEATYRALRIRHRDGEVDTADAIDQLGGLATSWRGDETELKTLRFLAQLEAQAGNYREAFEAMQSALQANAGAETTRLLQDEMGAVFSNLFLRGGADKMEPIKALALFYDFREMTPVGRRGDEMVRRLANRLVAMDLLDQAGELLRHQIDHRLKGAARAQVAADLGVVYLMDRKPEKALRILNQTRQAKLPRELERQRNIVEARALTENGRPDLALEIVRNMRGEDVERLRADTLWAAQSLREAGEQLEGLLGGRWSDDVPLADQERTDILRAAIAYSLADDAFSLSRLQSKFGEKMSNSPDAKAFSVVTRPADERGTEFLSVLDNLNGIDSLDVFLAEYQRKYLHPSVPGVDDGAPLESPQDKTVDNGADGGMVAAAAGKT